MLSKSCYQKENVVHCWRLWNKRFSKYCRKSKIQILREKDGRNRMEKMTRKIIAILTVAAMLFALPFIATADNQGDYPEQGTYEAVPAPAEEPVVAPAEEPVEEPAEEPAEGDASEEDASEEDALEEDNPEEGDPEEEYPEEVLEGIAPTGGELEGITPLGAELELMIDQLQDLRDEINWAIGVILAIYEIDPTFYTPGDWALFETILDAWQDLQNAPYITMNGVVVAQGFDEVFDWLRTNWANLSPAEQQDALGRLDLFVSDMNDIYRPAVFMYLEVFCDWLYPGEQDPNCDCFLCLAQCYNCFSPTPNPACQFCAPCWQCTDGTCPLCVEQPGDGRCPDCYPAACTCASYVLCTTCNNIPCTCPPDPPQPVDRGALSAAIGAAEGRVQANYTADSWNAFIAALEAARAVYANPNATQAQIDAALAALLAAQGGLVRVGRPSGERTTTVVTAVVAPQTGDTTSAQVPFVKLMISLFAISGLSLVKFRMRD